MKLKEIGNTDYLISVNEFELFIEPTDLDSIMDSSLVISGLLIKFTH